MNISGKDFYDKVSNLKDDLDSQLDSIRDGIRSKGVEPNEEKNLTTVNEDILKIKAGYPIPSVSGTSWKTQVSGVTDNLNAVTFANNVFVIVGDNGIILISDDGYRWSRCISGTTANLRDVIYANGQYVIVGDIESSGNRSIILTSPNAISWTKRTSGVGASDLYSVAYGNGIFIAVGSNNVRLTSTNGTSWAAGTINSFTFSVIEYLSGQFIVAGASGRIYTSPDGVTWTERRTGNEILTGISYNEGKYIVVGSSVILSSYDGIEWGEEEFNPSQYSPNKVSYDKGQYIATTLAGYVLKSIDGEVWEPLLVEGNSILKDIVCGNFIYIVVGEDGFISIAEAYMPVTSDHVENNRLFVDGYNVTASCGIMRGKMVVVGYGGKISISSDGILWTKVDSGVTAHLSSIIYANNQYVAVGTEGVIVTSYDAINWTRQDSGTTRKLSSIIYANNQYVAVGESGIILTSPDGNIWTPRTTEQYYLYWRDVVYANNQFIAVGEGYRITSSPDGITWTTRNSGLPTTAGPYLTSIIYANNQYVAVGTGGVIIMSSDGVVWEKPDTGETRSLTSIIYANNQYVAVGTYTTSSGFIISSTDGVVWNEVFVLPEGGPDDISYYDGRYIVLCDVGTTRGFILASVDAIRWTRIPLPSNARSIAYTQNNITDVYYGSFNPSSRKGFLDVGFTPKRVYLIANTETDMFGKINIADDRDFTINNENTETYMLYKTTTGNPMCIIDIGNEIVSGGFNYNLPNNSAFYNGIQWDVYAIG